MKRGTVRNNGGSKPGLLSTENGGLEPDWSQADQSRWPGPPTDAESLVRFMNEVDDYKDKELQQPDNVLVLDHPIGSVVYLRLATGKAPGFITGANIRPGCVVYLVSWANTRDCTLHYGFELTTEFEPSYE